MSSPARTTLVRRTIKKWLRVPKGTEPKYRRGSRPGKLTVFKAQLIQAFETTRIAPSAIGARYMRSSNDDLDLGEFR